MNREEERKLRALYINKVMKMALKPQKIFESIQYAMQRGTDSEYIRIKDKRGTAITLNITGNSLESVMHDIFKIVVIGEMGKHEKITPPANIITDRDELLRLAPLFG